MVKSLNSTTDYTDDTDYKMIHEEPSGEIIGAAMAVLNELKPKAGRKALRTRNDYRTEGPRTHRFGPEFVSGFLSR